MQNIGSIPESEEQKAQSRWKSYALTLGLVAFVGATNLIGLPYIGYRAAGFVFLVCALPLAVLNGLGPALLFAALSALTWDYFFIPPQFHFVIQTTEDALMNVTYFAVAIVTGILGNRLKVQEELLKKRERHTRLLYEFEKELASGRTLEEVLTIGENFFRHRLGFEGIALHGNENGNESGLSFSKMDLSKKEQEEANWVYRNERRAGKGTLVFGNSRFSYFPLSGTSNPTGVFIVELTESKPTAEKLLRRLCPTLGAAIEREKNRKLSERNQLLEDAEKLHQTLLNSVSHELRTPLTSMLGSLDHLEKKLTESAMPFYTELRLGAETLNQTVTHLLDWSRVTSGVLQLKRELIDLNDFLHTCITNVASLAQDHPINFLEFSSGPVVIRGDEKLLATAITNIIANSVLHSPKGSSIKISIHADEKFATVEIDDEGPGIKSSDRELIFQKFYKVSSSGGVGLGLSIVRAIIEAHAGQVRLKPGEGPGAGFLITLPIENLPERMQEKMVP